VTIQRPHDADPRQDRRAAFRRDPSPLATHTSQGRLRPTPTAAGCRGGLNQGTRERDQNSVLRRAGSILNDYIKENGFAGRCAMPNARDLIERARVFEERAEQAPDPISRQHYREMAAHYRSLAIEHQETMATPERELEH
jgi:hypothetical protein